jgi:hypothetical protein
VECSRGYLTPPGTNKAPYRPPGYFKKSKEQLAAKQEQMAQTIATLQAAEQQAAEQDIIQTRSSPPQPGPGLAPAAQKSAKAPETRRAVIVCASPGVPSRITATSKLVL